MKTILPNIPRKNYPATDTRYGCLEIKNGIMFFIFKKDLFLNLKSAIEVVRIRQEISGEKSFPVLIDSGGITGIDKKAREYFVTEKAQRGMSAAALLSNSFFATFLANLFLNLTSGKRTVPTKLFTNKKKALLWLEKYKKEF